ncbi:hypothetical protein ACNAN0_10115 [Agrilactobacillus fermenti]|uniref:hypothetical protein n=1 Tax=Agrilactobacillus fermenti TaxID=2586909 RepID=UPI003A5BAF2B
MSAHIIPAASNALMINYLESQGFKDVYLDSSLVTAQLLGNCKTTTLEAAAYVSYVQYMARITDMAVISDGDFNIQTPSELTHYVGELIASGCQSVIISDADCQDDIRIFEAKLIAALAGVSNSQSQIIVKLTGFAIYGLAGLEGRIRVIQNNNIAAILISNITNIDIPVIQSIQTSIAINLIIDNPNINYAGAEQLKPTAILDSYNVRRALTRSAETMSQNIIFKMFMGR